MTPIPVGALRTLLWLDAPNDVTDEMGGVTRAYAPLAQVWARVEPMAGALGLEADRETQAVTYRVTMRWRDDVRDGMRLREGARVLGVDAAFDPEGRRRVLTCLCREVGS